MALIAAVTLVSASAFAADPQIPWATGTGDTDSTHIAAMGEDLNAQHQVVTQTHEGVWATGTGTMADDEASLASKAPPVGDNGIHWW